MKLFNGEPVEVVLKPTDEAMRNAIETSQILMSEKIDRWILDRLTIGQLAKCIEQFKAEIESRLSNEPR
jgi:hypothetical protein